MSVAEARANFAEVLNAAIRGRVTYVTSRSRRVALVGPLSLTDDLEQLRRLAARGVLTAEEFDRASARLSADR